MNDHQLPNSSVSWSLARNNGDLQSTLGIGVNEAKDSLARIGASGNVNPGPGGSWVFMGYTGPEQVDWVTQTARVRHQGPCVVAQFVTLPAAIKAIEEQKGKDF